MAEITKKLFGRDIGMRSTFCKYDPCVIGEKKPIVQCDNCMVSLISDRFLGQKFTDEVLSKKYKKTKDLFTYVLIADTMGCNLNCWFCYAWKYLEPEDIKKCTPRFLTAEELAKQFDCKIRKTSDLDYLKQQVGLKNFLKDNEKRSATNHLNKELPFNRIRISGGEPLFSSRYFFQTEDTSSDIIQQTIKYWIKFFEELDGLIGKIKKEKLINIATFDSDWQDLKHPVWLTEVEGRIMVRFDTNGIIFGGEGHANLFYSELFKLFQEEKLNNIHI